MQKISELLDDELPADEAARLLQSIGTQPDLAEKFRRYQTIRGAIKNDNALITASPDFVSLVSSRIQDEPTHLIPNASRRWVQHDRFRRSHKIVAAAASIAVIAFIAYSERPKPSANVQIATADSTSDAVSGTNARDAHPINQQISDYLQAHNGGIYSNGQADFQPYAQVTTYSQK